MIHFPGSPLHGANNAYQIEALRLPAEGETPKRYVASRLNEA
jgi:hypothetical protein